MNNKVKYIIGGIIVCSLIAGSSYKVNSLNLDINRTCEGISSCDIEIERCILSEEEQEELNGIHLRISESERKNDIQTLELLKKQYIELVAKSKKNSNEFIDGYLERISKVDISKLNDNYKSIIKLLVESIRVKQNNGYYKDAEYSLNNIDNTIKEFIDNQAKLDKELEEKAKKEEQEKQKLKEQEKNNNIEAKAQTSKTNNSTESSPTGGSQNNPEVQQSFVANLDVSKRANQIITVVGNGGCSARISFHIKSNGLWKQVLSTSGYVGRNGITYNKREGDGKTPAGIYGFGTAFGVAGNPGTSLQYKQITSNDYWVDDSNSQYYNKWVNTEIVSKDWNSAEHLIDYGNAYRYGVAINYNSSCIPGKGSAIFLHCSTGGGTAGCVSVPQNVMISLLNNINGGTLIVIAPNIDAIYNY